ncbi:DUF2752 domain-containing protein [Planctomycetota bacterium]
MRVISRIQALFLNETHADPDRTAHIMYLIIFGVFLLLPVLISMPAGEGPEARLGPMRLPEMCASQAWFNAACPGCGLTRSFVHLTHGRVGASFRLHRLGPLLYLCFIVLGAYRIWCLKHPGKEIPSILRGLQFYVPMTMAILLIVNWSWGLFSGGNGF